MQKTDLLKQNNFINKNKIGEKQIMEVKINIKSFKNNNAFSDIFDELQKIAEKIEPDSPLTDELIQKAIYLMDLRDRINELFGEIRQEDKPLFEEDFMRKSKLMYELLATKMTYNKELEKYKILFIRWINRYICGRTLDFFIEDLSDVSNEYFEELYYVIDELLVIDYRITFTVVFNNLENANQDEIQEF